jgi:hypothetical protein
LEGLQITKEKVESLSSQIERLKWRRSKVLELSSQGHSQPEISRILQVSLGTVNNDLSYLRQQAQENIQKHIQERLPEEYQRCLTGINQVLKLSWQIANGSKNSNNNDNNGNNNTTMTITADDKTRLQALSLINDCYKYIMDLTTNGVVITDAIRFVQNSKEKLATSSNEQEDGKESKGPDNNDDKEQLKEEQEKRAREISESKATTNHVF